MAQHVSSEGTVAGCGDTLETISTLPSLPFSAPHYSSPPTCGPASHLPAFCLPLHLLSLFFFFFWLSSSQSVSVLVVVPRTPLHSAQCWLHARGFVVPVVQTRRDPNGSEFMEEPRSGGKITMGHDGPPPGLTPLSRSKP